MVAIIVIATRLPPHSILLARDRDGRTRLGAGALHVEATVAGLDVIATQKAHPLDAAGGAGQGVGFWNGEDDRRGAGDEIEKRRRRLATVRGRVQFIGNVAAVTAESNPFCGGVLKIDHIGRGLAHGQSVDLAFELDGEVVTTIGASRRWRECEQSHA